MARVLLVLVAIGLTIYALLDIGRTPRGDIRVMPKLLWFVAAFIPVMGPVAWLFLGRPSRPKRAAAAGPATGGLPFGGGRKRGPVAPDDDPEFLRRLSDEAWSRKMEEKRRAHPHEPEGTAQGATGDTGDTAGAPEAPRPDDTTAGDAAAGDPRTGPDDPGRSPA